MLNFKFRVAALRQARTRYVPFSCYFLRKHKKHFAYNKQIVYLRQNKQYEHDKRV